MSTTRSRSERLEVRTTKEERALIDRAVAEQGTDLTEFVVSHPTVAARLVLADRIEFALDAESPEFEASPTDELHLFLLKKDIRRAVN